MMAHGISKFIIDNMDWTSVSLPHRRVLTDNTITVYIYDVNFEHTLFFSVMLKTAGVKLAAFIKRSSQVS